MSVRKRLYFGDYSEEDLQCPQKAKMMWKLGKRQIDVKNKQLKILRIKNFRLNKKIKTLENLVTHLKEQNRIFGLHFDMQNKSKSHRDVFLSSKTKKRF